MVKRGRKPKYESFTDHLIQCRENTVQMTFEQINKIVSLPDSAYNNRSVWANNTSSSASAFSKSWLKAGFRAIDPDLKNQTVVFIKPTKPTSAEDELLLTVPYKLSFLELDEYHMVCLNCKNSRIVEELIKADPQYQSEGEIRAKEYHQANDHSEDAYYEIIRCISNENSTRTSNDTIRCLAKYCSDPGKNFLERLKNGDTDLVDDIISYVTPDHRKEKSLSSKICRYLNEWFFQRCDYTIIDSVVKSILPYYLNYHEVDRHSWDCMNFEAIGYSEFYRVFSELRGKVAVLNNHQLDHLIWYSFKDDPIRSEVAKALATVPLR